MKNKTLMRSILICLAILLGLSQRLSAQDKTVTIDAKDVKATYILSEIEKQTSYLFVFQEVDLNFELSLKADKEPVRSVLNRIFKDRSLEYTLENNHIIIRKKVAETPQKENITIKGVVKDQNGNPVIGAGIIVRGDKLSGTTSDLNGEYELVAPQDAVIEVSSIGYKTVTISIGGRAIVDVNLSEDMNTLDEVVVVGYGSLKRRNIVGSVDQVGSEVVGNRSNVSLARSLQGEIPGLNIQFTDSKPSRGATFNVRGETSIGAGGSALVLIDGVQGSLNTINPNDVASISVLKDASSTAVYGARGAFGVILVTTKNPLKETPKITYNGSVTANRRTVIPDLITDGVEWVDWWKAAYNGYYNGSKTLLNHIDSTVPYTEGIYQEMIRRKNDPSLSKVTQLKGHPMFGWAYMESTDWFDLFYKDVNFSTEHGISMSGGNENADYYISGRFYGMDGIYRVGDESYKKYDLRAKGSLKVRPWLTISDNISVAVIDQYEPKHPRNNFAVQRAINHVGMPLSPVKNPDGTWTAAAAITGYASFSEKSSYRTNDYMYLRNKLSADIDILKNVLKLQADYSFNYTTRKRVDVQNPVEYSKMPGQILYESLSAGATLTQTNYETIYHAANAYLTYAPDLGLNHDLSLLAGWNLEHQNYATLQVSRAGFITSSKPSFTLMNGVSENPVAGGNEWAYIGAFYRLNYSYKGKYLLEASGRYDGSSKFPVNSMWGFFPSASVAWRISDEPWMKWTKPALDDAKIRVSAGTMGNGNVSPYSYTSEMTISTAGDIILGGEYPSYTTVGTIAPASLTWEKSSTYDIGLDLAFLNNRLSFSGDIYRRVTSDMYTPSVALPSVYGAASPKGNNASMNTDGWEITLSWRDSFMLGGKPFNYSAKAMIWDSKSVITKYINDTGTLGTVAGYINNGGSPSSYYVNMTVGEIWGYTVVGLFKDQDDIDSSAIHNFAQASDKITRPGQVKFADLDGNGFIDPGNFTVDDHGDLTIIGNQNPRFCYGINLSASWNGIGLSVFLQGVGKRDWYPGSDAGYFWGKYGRPFFSAIPSIHALSSDDVYSPEKNNWDTAYWPRVTTYQSNGNKNWTNALEIPNTRYLQNASYLRVKNIQLDYSLPEKACKAIHMHAIQFYLSGENLFTFTPLHRYAPNLDPEGLSYDSDFASAAEGYTYPTLKSITLGVNITF